MPEIPLRPEEPSHELRECLDRELNALPEKYRLPIVLCELEGRSRKEVARQLALPEGTLSWRLATARKMLAKRLARYGPFTAAAVSAVLSDSAAASLPPSLAGSTVKCVLTGGSATVAALAAGVIKAMFITKLKTVAWAFALVVLVGGGAAGLRVAAAAGRAQPPAPATPRGVRDELDVMRLEIEALRKDLKITKERVKALEEAAARPPIPFVANLNPALPNETPQLPSKPKRSTLAAPMASAAFDDHVNKISMVGNSLEQLEQLFEHLKSGRITVFNTVTGEDETAKRLQALERVVRGQKELTPLKKGLGRAESPDAPQLKTATDQTAATPAVADQWRAWAQSFAAAEEALRKVRQHPADLQFLDALESAVGQLKGLNADKTLKKLRVGPIEKREPVLIVW
jgi:hypothetical protein